MANYVLRSPDEQLVMSIDLIDGALSYSVVKDNVTVVESSPVGAVLSGVDLTCGLTAVSHTYGSINDQYELPAFKKAVCIDHCNTLAIDVEKDGYPMTLEARAYDDGAALRIVFHKEEILEKEIVGFAIPESARSVFGMKFRFTYEDEFHRIPLDEMHQNLWICPMLIESGKGVWGLITEAAVFGDYGGSMLSADKEDPHVLRITAAPDEFTQLKLPVSTPWRVILAGSLDAIVNSNTIENLNPPCEVEDTSFVKAGMAAWSCMTDRGSSRSFKRQQDFIDLAAKMNWPYNVVDGGWRDNVDIPKLVEYAKSKGVDIWVHSHRRFLMDPEVAERDLKLWASWGVVGVKIDFFESDSRKRIALYDLLSELCAKYHLMVNFHGCSKPTGQIRRWPHVISHEGVMGGENFQNHATEYFVQTTARHNCTLPFTRNVVGSMDYTPSTYGSYRTGTTDPHQTALPLVFTCYVTHIMENPEVLCEHPCAEFLKGLPCGWDESKLLEGYPGSYVTMARRKDSTWYVGGICASRSRNARVDLSFLEEGKYKATLYQDGLDDLHADDVAIGTLEPMKKELFDEWEENVSRPTSHQHDLRLAKISEFEVDKTQKLVIPCVQDGGFALKLEKI